MRNALATLGQMALAVLVAVAVAVIALIAIAQVQWPAFPSSNQLHALTTVGQVACLAGLVAVGFVWRRCARPRGRVLTQLAGLVFVSAFTVVTLGMPLGATRLYLFGISVDQQFRTEYVTRLADSPALRDMTYLGLPPYYPPGWFWIGGRAAALSGAPAWEIFKPWAITSITIAVAVALVLWWRMVRFEYALIVTTATAAVTLAYGSPEPYSAMITMLLPPMLVLTWSGLRAGDRPDTAGRAGWGSVIAAIDPRPWLGLPPAEAGEGRRLIVAGHDGRVVALAVDAVEGVFTPVALEAAPDLLGEAVEAVAETAEGTARMVVRLDGLVRLAESAMAEGSSGGARTLRVP